MDLRQLIVDKGVAGALMSLEPLLVDLLAEKGKDINEHGEVVEVKKEEEEHHG